MKFTQMKEKINQLFWDQVKTGKQSTNIDSHCACGQFLDKYDLSQRGLHGTAAAIYVLSNTTDSKYDETINRLCDYSENRKTYDNLENVNRDDNNTIKQAELLFSLCYVKAGTRDVHDFKKIIVTKLLESKHDNNAGWGYFLTESNKNELLPTAFSIKALIKAGYSSNIQIETDKLRNHLKTNIKNHIDNPTTLSIYIYCLYVLVFYDENYTINESDYKSIFKYLQKSKYLVLNHSYEQNLEYQGNNEHYYVRIPWQLYFLALSSKLNKWTYLNRYSQKRIKELEDGILNSGFKYKYSGEHISSRTYSIIYEIIFKIEENTPKSLLVNSARIINKITPILIYLLYFLVFVFMLISIYKWIENSAKLIDLAPEFVGYFTVLILSIKSKK